jgi:hypothetical protein
MQLYLCDLYLGTYYRYYMFRPMVLHAAVLLAILYTRDLKMAHMGRNM